MINIHVLEEQGFKEIPITRQHTAKVRLHIAQALIEDLSIHSME